MIEKVDRTTYDESLDVIARATRRTPNEIVVDLGLSWTQVYWLARWLKENRLLFPPKFKPVKVGQFQCHRCGAWFVEEYKTSHFRYCPNCRRR